jgi:hypothetical protein
MNVLILCPDQLRADYLSCYGHPSIGTDNIDRLASEGVRLNRAYCSAPLCGPSAMITDGRWKLVVNPTESVNLAGASEAVEATSRLKCELLDFLLRTTYRQHREVNG